MLDLNGMHILSENRRDFDKVVAGINIFIELEIEHFRDVEFRVCFNVRLYRSHQCLVAEQEVFIFLRLDKDDLFLAATCRHAEKVAQNLIPNHRHVHSRAPVKFRKVKDHADRTFHAFAAVVGRKNTDIGTRRNTLVSVVVFDAGVDMVLIVQISGRSSKAFKTVTIGPVRAPRQRTSFGLTESR